MKYQVVVSTDYGQLAAAVNEQIQQGWKPQGGIAVGAFENGTEYYQALVSD